MFLAERQNLARELRQLRQRAGLSTHKLAQRADIHQSKISRIENTKATISDTEIEAWAKACRASTTETSRLLELAERATAEVLNLRTAIREGLPSIQHNIATLEQSATMLREYQTFLVPGLLQTADYARHLFEIGHSADRSDLPAAVAARIDRQTLLYNQDHHFEFILTEAALRWRIATPHVYMAQLDRIANVATLPNVEVGILPLAQELPAWHWHSFIIFDDCKSDVDPMVLVETATAAVEVSDEEDVNKYRKIFADLRGAAITGGSIFQLLDSIRAGLISAYREEASA
ncbi:MAG: helix-turn-helix domain-containing protein [Candidatus Dormibacteraceae bacterium]